MADPLFPERYFYHSFPRRSRSSDREITSGLLILELIRDFGLVLTPEIAHWEYPHADGTPSRSASMIQRRASFTELSPSELGRHSEEFGHFALEFDIETLKQLGAMPVFYVPRTTEGAGMLGYTIVMQIIDAMRLTDRIARVLPILEQAPAEQTLIQFTFGMSDNQKVYELNPAQTKEALTGVGHALAPPQMISDFLEGTLNLFYPADGRNREALQYYRQREWRISGNYAIRGEEVMRLPSEAMIERLLALDEDFFGRAFPPSGQEISNTTIKDASQKRLIDWVYVLPGLGDQRILEMARRVIVPDSAVETTNDILKALNAPPPVAGLSTLGN
jgi:hypothetical protein